MKCYVTILSLDLQYLLFDLSTWGVRYRSLVVPRPLMPNVFIKLWIILLKLVEFTCVLLSALLRALFPSKD